MSAKEYHKGYSVKLFDTVKEALARLDKAYDVIVIEGAGSPAEVNLHDNDIVNMRVARHLQAPVLLIADIDRGVGVSRRHAGAFDGRGARTGQGINYQQIPGRRFAFAARR